MDHWIIGNCSGHGGQVAKGAKIVPRSREQGGFEVMAAEGATVLGEASGRSVKATEEQEEKPQERTS